MDKQVRQPDRQTDGQEKTDKTETNKTDKWMDKTRQTDYRTDKTDRHRDKHTS